jgi:signal transduction histidine kinase
VSGSPDDPPALYADEQRIVLGEDGRVVSVDRGGIAAKLRIKPGRALCAQLTGFSPVLQEMLLQDGLLKSQRSVVIPVSAGEDGILLRMRALAASERETALAISAARILSRDEVDNSLLELGAYLDVMSRGVALATGDFTPKEAAAQLLAVVSSRLRMDAAAFFILPDHPWAKLLTAFGRTKRRGVPYPPVDSSHPRLAPLLEGDLLVTFRPPGGDLPEGLADVCVPDAAQVLVVPASSTDGVVGLLVVSTVQQRELEAQELHVLKLAAQLLGMVAQRRLLSTESERSSAVLETAYAVSRTISRSLDLEDTFQIVASNAARLVRGMRCLVFELDTGTGELIAVASSHKGDVDLAGLRLRLDDEAMEQMRRHRHLQVAVSDLVWNAPVSAEVRRALDVRTGLFLPMLAHDQLVGSLALLSPAHNRSLSEKDVALAEDLTDQAAAAVHNARLYRDLVLSRENVRSLMGRMARIRDNERRELASIVHDDVIQSVVGAIYKLEAARDELHAGKQEPLSDAIRTLQGAVVDARRVISDLRPPALEGLGLTASLRTLIDRSNLQGPAFVSLDIAALPELPPTKAAALYRIVREALVNAQRHADALSISVRIVTAGDAENPEVRLSVRDDGKGWKREVEHDPEHFGVAMMEEQAALAGGRLSIESRPGEGVSIETAFLIDH